MTERRFLARPGPEESLADGQLLEDHLEGVAWRAGLFARAFSSGEWGHLAGLLHDIGKYQEAFQSKLRGAAARVEHSSAGAALAASLAKQGLPLAFAIAGHHAGLANLAGSQPGQPAPLKQRLSTGKEILASLSRPVARYGLPAPPARFTPTGEMEEAVHQRLNRSLALWIRFLFSALVDADRLDAEAFRSPKSAQKRGSFESLADLADRLDQHLDTLIGEIPVDRRTTPVNQARAGVLASCRAKASAPPGAFSLTVPTGGGKTLSAMAFALRHACRHGLRRVIVVIPYTSIIEQNARVYGAALGAKNVIEHHSSLDPQRRQQHMGEEIATRHELAAENWDAPVIVTTTVQFFETLFTNRPGRCRKLHNVARSVIVLDEVQTLPPEFLTPILEASQELLDNYGCSLVLATATPPALAAREGFPAGIRDVVPIIADPSGLAERLKRVTFHWPDPRAAPTSLGELATRLAAHEQVLAVVHRRADARELACELIALEGSDSVFHLSALMCPAHRLATIDRIRRCLARAEPCRLISTQLIEAGVDLDFPVVFRALGGLDSVAQAAGRCNREGLRPRGEVHVFKAESPPPAGTPRQGMGVAQAMLEEAGNDLDLTDPTVFERFFRSLYLVKDLDAKGIQAQLHEFNFATAADRFRLIEDGFTSSVVVPYAKSAERLRAIRASGVSSEGLRGLQPFVVSVYPDAFKALDQAGGLEEIVPNLFALRAGFEHLYDETFGLEIGDRPAIDPIKLII